MGEQVAFAQPQERLFLTVDFDGALLDLSHIVRDYQDFFYGLKVGQGFWINREASAMQNMLNTRKVISYFDAKYSDDPDQMEALVQRTADLGYSYVSVAPSAGVASLKSAAHQQGSLKVVAALSSPNREQNDLELRNILAANQELGADHQIDTLMCNVSCVEKIKNLGGFTVIATGIRMPSAHDQPRVATPTEALAMGADYLAVGRIITEKNDKADAFRRVLDNMLIAG